VSLAFPPDYEKSQTFFVFYTDKNNSAIIAQYKASKTNPDSAIVNSRSVLLSIPGKGHLGDLQFDKNGYLYITICDNSYYNRTTNFAQDGTLLLGKMLRLNVNISTPPYYSIPPDNPYVNNPNVRHEIWSFGLRNAWRWSFDKNGDMWIPDVGGDNWEEVNVETPTKSKGANYGWPCYEGNASLITDGCGSKSGYVFPVFTYPHNTINGGHVIIGGFVYRGNAYPAMSGYYICVDFDSSRAWKIKPNGSGGWNVYLQKDVPTGIESFGEGEDGELYAASINGTVYRVQTIESAISSEVNSLSEISKKNLKSYVHPTFIDNSIVTLELKEAFKYVRLIDMSGREIMIKTLNNKPGRIILDLPKLNQGIYIIQLVGEQSMQQKIYVTH
jgi:glucose/arabinose dehydrogenase